MSINIESQADRASFISQITTNEDNLSRKREMQRRFDVYRDRQDRYIEENLRKEFSADTIKEMRKVLSINLSKKVIDQLASIYNKEPTRTFENATDSELEQIEKLYTTSKIDPVMRLANRYFKLFKQTAIMVVPQNGKMVVRALGPHEYDVVPVDGDPEMSQAYVLNVFDLEQHRTYREPVELIDKRYRSQNETNEEFADDDDRLDLARDSQQFIWWSDTFFFVTDGKGKVVDAPFEGINPINEQPFIDVAVEKDFQFFVRRGQNITQFALDFGLQLSDLANIQRLQGYAQGVVVSDKQPKNVKVGPNELIWLQKDLQSEFTPSFSFASPNPDLVGSLALLEAQVKFFLSSEGLETSTITGTGDSRQFSSGVDRLLAMFDRFEASSSDMDLFKIVEFQVFNLLRKWSNFMQDFSENGLIEELRGGQLSDKIELSVQFAEPMPLETERDKLDHVRERIELDLMSRKQALAKLDGISEEEAEKLLAEVDSSGSQTTLDEG